MVAGLGNDLTYGSKLRIHNQHQLMKTNKRLVASYLYADGHAFLVYEKQDPEAGLVEWCALHNNHTSPIAKPMNPEHLKPE